MKVAKWPARLCDVIFTPVFILGGDLKERVGFSQQTRPSSMTKYLCSGSGFLGRGGGTEIMRCQQQSPAKLLVWASRPPEWGAQG